MESHAGNSCSIKWPENGLGTLPSSKVQGAVSKYDKIRQSPQFAAPKVRPISSWS